MKTRRVVLTLALTGIVTAVTAATPGLNFNAIKKMGMGDAGVALSTDDTALYVNPAGLARVRSLQIKSPRLRLKVGSEITDRFSDISNFFSGSNANIAQLTQLVGLDGTIGLEFSPLASVTMPGFGISLLTGYDMTIKINHDASLSAFGQSDSAIAIGAAQTWTFFDHPIALGMSFKGLHRGMLVDKLTGDSRIELESGEVINRINNGTFGDSFQQFGTWGIGIDIGAMSTIYWDTTPITLAGAVRNIGATLTGDKPLSAGTQSTSITLPLETVIGAAATPDLPVFGTLTVALDYKLSPSNSVYTSLNLGVEKQLFGDLLHLRGGINQGYITGGIGTDLGLFKFDYAYYVRERGASAGDEPDPMHIIEIGFVF